MMSGAEARIMIASDAGADAEVVRRLLHDEFPRALVSSQPAALTADFDRYRPQVLVLAFKTLEGAERCYLGLYRGSSLVSQTPHRTLLLCNKDELQGAYDRCRNGNFDDYVLFWPLVHDATRLPMSVHLALRALDSHQAAAPLAQLAVQARRIAELEALLDRQLVIGNNHAEQARRSLQDAQVQVGTAFDDFSQRVLGTGLDDALKVNDAARVRREIGRLSETAVQAPLRRATQALQPVPLWMGSLKTELAHPLQAARALAEQAQRLRPLLLVVDDDEIVRKLLARVLIVANYDVETAAGAGEAMAALRGRRPDLILMDVQMPDIDGIELTRRLKATPAYSGIPVVMLTGQSEKDVIVGSLDAGAADFIVKPFDRDILLKKVARYLGG